MKNLGLLMMFCLIVFSAACGKSETSAANANAVNLKTEETSNQKSEQISSAVPPVSLKAPEPCGWFEKSLKLKTEEYKEFPTSPGKYACGQGKGLVNYSSFTYNVTGDATTVKELYVGVTMRPQNTEKLKTDLMKLLWVAANEVAEKAGGQKLTEEMLTAIVSGEEKEFPLEPGADAAKPQIKTAFVNNTMSGFYKPESYRSVTMKF